MFFHFGSLLLHLFEFGHLAFQFRLTSRLFRFQRFLLPADGILSLNEGGFFALGFGLSASLGFGFRLSLLLGCQCRGCLSGGQGFRFGLGSSLGFGFRLSLLLGRQRRCPCLGFGLGLLLGCQCRRPCLGFRLGLSLRLDLSLRLLRCGRCRFCLNDGRTGLVYGYFGLSACNRRLIEDDLFLGGCDKFLSTGHSGRGLLYGGGRLSGSGLCR